VNTSSNGLVCSIDDVFSADLWVNGGYFIFKKEIFNYIKPGEELVYQPFQRLIAERQLITYKYNGFWACMDTFKEKQQFDDMFARGEPLWEVWRNNGHL
jgi:glucose-1-phosphate cytidylyltransferase